MGKKVYVECELEWTKLREEDRDMGPRDGSDMANNFDAKLQNSGPGRMPNILMYYPNI